MMTGMLIGWLVAFSSAPAVTEPVPSEPAGAARGADSDGNAAVADGLDALLAGEPSGETSVAELLGGTVPDALTIAARIADSEQSIEQLRRTAAALEVKLSEVGADLPPLAPGPEALPDPPEAPTAPGIARPGRPNAAERRGLREHKQLMEQHNEATAEYEALARQHAVAVAEHQALTSARTQQLEAARADIESQLTALRARLRVQEAQLTYLRRLAVAYQGMSPPALRSLDLLAMPRAPIREQAQNLSRVDTATMAMLARLKALDEMLAAGRLMGFVTEQAAARRRLETVVTGLTEAQVQMAALRQQLLVLAESQEAAGRALRETLLWSLGSDAGVATRDQLYTDHLRQQRLLRRAIASTSSGGAPGFGGLIERANLVLPRPGAVGDVFAADQAVGTAQQVSLDLSRVLATVAAAPDRWTLAFERELVTLLEPLASEATRARAQQLTTEIVEDVRIEAVDAWGRAVDWATATPNELRTLASNWRDTATRTLAALALLLLAWAIGTKRINPIRYLVRRATRWPILRGRIGLVVRWGNVLQTIFPGIAVYLLLFATARTIGFTRVEVQLTWIFVHWIGLYWIGRQMVLGATRPYSRGRPALINARPETVELLRVTYSRLGLIFAISFILEELIAGWFGAGRVLVLIDTLIVLWTGAWAFWAALAWRERLGSAWAALESTAFESKLAQWMKQSRLGALLSPVATARLTANALRRAVWWLLGRVGVITYLRAQSLSRLSRDDDENQGTAGKLPDDYLNEFPLYPLLGDTEAFVLPRPESVDPIREQIVRWSETRADGSLVLVGDKGIGKTTLLAQLAPSLEHGVTFHTWGSKATSELEVARELGPLFGCPEARDVAALITAASAGPEQVVFLDEVHNVFLRTIDGYRGFDALVELVNGTNDTVFWVLAFNTYAWEFLNESRGRTHYFRRLLRLEGWSVDEIKELIDKRNKRSGYTVEFDPVILDADADTRDFQLVESADGFFRLLWQTAAGNPRVSLYLWLQSLHLNFGSIRAKLFRQPDIHDVDGLTDELVFVLASICQHENLSPEDLSTVLRIKPGRARFAVQFLREAGVIEPKHGAPTSFTLAPRYYQQTLKFLRSRHLLFQAS